MRGTVMASAVMVGCLYESRPPDFVVDAGPADGAPGARITDGLIGLWELAENGGTTVGDTSGLPAVALSISDMTSVSWVPGALQVEAPVDINSGFVSNRISLACRDSDEVTLEAWVTPATTSQTGSIASHPARVITLTTPNISSHQITLGQNGEAWIAQVKTTAAGLDAHGGPMLAAGSAALVPTHLVVTSNAAERRFYIDGALAIMDDRGGNLPWEAVRTVAIGGDPNRRNTWLGTVHLAAMYDRALDATEVETNFRAGPAP
jgi:hypothetical protein